MAEVFHLLGYLGLHGKLVHYNAIGPAFGECDEATVRKAVKTHARRWPSPLDR